MKYISTHDAPAAIGPYSQAVVVGNLVFCSGQIPLDCGSMQIVGENIVDQANQVLSNIKSVVEASGSSVNRIIKTTVFLKNMSHFTDFNKVYSDFFTNHKPARSTVEVSALPKNVLIEIECIAEIA